MKSPIILVVDLRMFLNQYLLLFKVINYLIKYLSQLGELLLFYIIVTELDGTGNLSGEDAAVLL